MCLCFVVLLILGNVQCLPLHDQSSLLCVRVCLSYCSESGVALAIGHLRIKDFFAKYINIPSARGTAAGYHIDVIRRSGSTWRTQRDFSPFANCIQCVGVLLIWPTAYSFHILIDFLFLILESV